MVKRMLIATSAVLGLSWLAAPASPAAEAPTPSVDGRSAAAKADCDWTSAVAGYGSWAKSTGPCAWIGKGHRQFSWQVPPYSNGRICVEAKGYKYNATKKKNVAKWYSVGCGTSGTAAIPWALGAPNPTAAMPEVRAKVQPGFLGGAYRWI